MATPKLQAFPKTFAATRIAMEATGLSFDKLRQLRQDGTFAERIYWVRVPKSTHILWNVPMVIDWLVNGSESPAHQRAIENFIASLPSSQAA